MKRLIYSIAILIAVLLMQNNVFACGHEGMYVGLGGAPLVMYTSNYRNSDNSTQKIHFSPGFGGNLTLGYDFRGKRFGMQLLGEFHRMKLNREEWINSITNTLEGIVHLREWPNGLDIHVLFGGGWTYLMEGQVNNNSRSIGIVVNAGPGITYFFKRTEKFTGAISFQLPLRYIRYMGRNLSQSGANVYALPARLSMQIGF